MTTATPGTAAASIPLRAKRIGYAGFLVSQFLGSFNDNAFRMLILLVALPAGAGGAADGWSRERLLAVTGVLFMLPLALFSLPAGSAADRYGKRGVLLATKLLEVVVMALATAGFALGHVGLLLGLFFLIALQSALYSPAKFGILPELLDDEELSEGNGAVEMLTFAAIFLGMVATPHLWAFCGGRAAGRAAFVSVSAILAGLAVLGTLATLLVPRLPPADPGRRLSLHPLTGLDRYRPFIQADRPVRLALAGIAAFWSVGLLLQQTSMLHATTSLRLGETGQTLPYTAIAVGIGLGSWLAGKLSERKIELGLLPIGAAGLFGCSLALALVRCTKVGHLLPIYAGLGVAGGFFIVPLNALLQHRSPSTDRGGMVAVSNFGQAAGMTGAAVLFLVLTEALGATAQDLFFIAALLMLGTSVALFRLMPEALARFVMWVLAHALYRVRVSGREHLPPHGPALLVCNHVSFVDGLLVLASTHRFVRFIMDKGFAEIPVARWILGALRVIPISRTEGPKVLVNALRAAAEALREGHVVCIFAEGEITRTGQMLPFRRGIERILRDAPPGTPVIPLHLDRVWGSVFSFRGHRFVLKRPRRLPYPVTVTIGRPLPANATIFEVRQAVQELGAEAFVHRREDQEPLHRAFARTARRSPFRLAMADSTGVRRSYLALLARSVLLARLLRERWKGQERVGLLLPPTVAGAAANIAALFAGRVPVNLNYTAPAEALRSAAAQCGIRTVLTSRAFLERVPVTVPGEAIFLEDLAATPPPWEERLGALAMAALAPMPLLERYAGRSRPAQLDDLATVIFSSGSTGDPKGVMLTHANIVSNVEGLVQLYDPGPEDGILGVLPFFHSFGFTATIWFPVILGLRVIYHVNPVDAPTIGALVRQYGPTFLLGTPTFLQQYTRRVEAGDFGSLKYVIAGAEKLPDRVADAFRDKFGADPYEGYGCTECSPIVAVNAPDFRARGFRQVASKRGRIGHAIPGVTVRVVDPVTFRVLPPGEEGMLLVKGPNVMKGYLGRPDLTAEVIRDGWYVTGDIAKMEEDGFVLITDRLSRFSKIGGEMVPHVRVEEALHRALGAQEQVLVVTGVPDERKGERLVVMHTLPEERVRALAGALGTLGLPNLWLPRPEAFHRVDAIPLTGTGKTDLRKVKELALGFEEAGGKEPAPPDA
jgi:acyl-[acyl-carrier-protein]-phospholipid O-acyltransferase/long-chain-fatty-acid--[acyl-carrier-protein] ligase